MLDLFDTVEVIAPPMTPEESQACVDEIKNGIVNVRRRLLEWDEREGWKALGYASFREGAQAEFGYKQSYVYELRASAEIERNLLEAGFSSALENPIPQRHLHPLMPLSPDVQREVWREAVDTAPNGKITGPHVQAVVDRMTGQNEVKPYSLLPNGVKQCNVCGELWAADIDYCPYCNHTHEQRIEYLNTGQPQPKGYEPKERANQAMGTTVYSHNSLDYYTPQYVTDAARAVMGGIDLDPASCEMAQAWIKAAQYYTITDDGLSQPWAGRVWLNPPYSYTDGRSNQDLWSERLVNEYLQGNVTDGVLLVKAALGYKWFERLWDVWPVCFMRERLSFVMPDGTDDGQSKQATAIFYIGRNVAKFTEVFRAYGRVILPEDQNRG